VRVFLGFLLVVAGALQQVFSAGVDAANTAVIVNVDDPLSVKTGNYYISTRAIPERNLIRLSLGASRDVISVDEFVLIQRQIRSKTASHIQAYALAWARPFRVGCMSITAAIGLGYDTSYCAEGCRPTRQTGYYDSASSSPFVDFGIRPAMMLAADTFEDARRLIDKGIQSDYSRPLGDAYLLDTHDAQRNVRSVHYEKLKQALGGVLAVRVENKNWLRSTKNVLYYFTGVAQVRYLDTIDFVPGAVADHLTSAGGVLYGGGQMSSLQWLRAGVTGSYGTVQEPCNYLAKFPVPGVLIQHYMNGDSLVEAYWKSVAMPGQGVFLGDPLASPYKGCRLKFSREGMAERLVNRQTGNLVLRENTRCSPESY
jgi:uncharacterized protein (TIGR03790 family)